MACMRRTRRPSVSLRTSEYTFVVEANGLRCDPVSTPASTPGVVCAQVFPVFNVICPRTIKMRTTGKTWNRGYSSCITVIDIKDLIFVFGSPSVQMHSLNW